MAAARRVLAAVVAALALASAPGADASAVLRRAVRGDGALQPQQAAQQVKQVAQQVKQVQQTQQVKEQPAERLDVNGAVDPSAPASLDPPQPDDRKAHPDAMWNGPPSWANYQDPLVAGEDDQVWEAMMSMPEGLRDALFAKEHPGAKGAKGGGGPAPCPCEGQAGCPCRTLVDADVKPEAPPTNSTCGCGGQPQCGCEPAGPPPATASCDCWEMPVCPCRVEAALASDKTFVTPELTGGGPCGCLGTADCPCSPTLNYVAPEIDTSAPTIVPTGGLEIEESESSGSGSGSGSGSSSGSDESSATTTVKSAISGGAPAESSSASS